MSEYFTLEVEPTADPDVVELITNQTLTEGSDEVYPNAAAGEVGSPIAQTLFNAVDGLQALTLTEDALLVRRDPSVPWEALIDDVRDALRDFFL
jgi:hypothetical protein